MPAKQQIVEGDCLEVLRTLPAKSVQCCVTSPPYWGLRSYGFKADDPARKKMIGLEPTFDRHLWNLVRVFREVRRVLHDDGTLWLNYGDAYEGGGRGGGRPQDKQATNISSHVQPSPPTGLAAKNLIGMAWRVAFALQDDGWILRSDIIWHKRSPMPESVRDRPTRSHEYIFLLSKGPRYFYDQEAGREAYADDTASRYDYRFVTNNGKTGQYPSEVSASCKQSLQLDGQERFRLGNGRNMRSVWTLSTEPTKEAHFATFPTELVARCLKVGTSDKGCCVACGAPWKRTVNGERVATRPATAPKRQGLDDKPANRDGRRHISVNRQSEWRSGCDCNEATKPCTVLDPFSGAGTTGVVCRRMGLDFIGIELNPDYCTLARKRISRAMDEYEPEVPQAVGQLELIA